MASSSVFSSNKSAIDPDPSVIGGGGSTPPVHPNNDWTARYPYASGDYTNNLVGASLTNNGTTPTVDGVRGDVAGFDGVNDFFTDADGASNSTGAASWAVWLNANAIGKMIVGNALVTSYIYFQALNTIRVHTTAGVNRQFNLSPAVSLNGWFYLTVTRSVSDNFNVYINKTISTTGAINDTGTIDLDKIGSWSSGGSLWDGEQAFNTYWARELSLTNIEDNYDFEVLPQP